MTGTLERTIHGRDSTTSTLIGARDGGILAHMHGELFALLIVALLLVGAAYSGSSARSKRRGEKRKDPQDTRNL